MAENGIGASVKRKEDNRFLTGKGNYTDDINRPGQTYAVLVRSPHAHATINSIDTTKEAEVIKSSGLPTWVWVSGLIIVVAVILWLVSGN